MKRAGGKVCQRIPSSDTIKANHRIADPSIFHPPPNLTAHPRMYGIWGTKGLPKYACEKMSAHDLARGFNNKIDWRGNLRNKKKDNVAQKSLISKRLCSESWSCRL